MWIAGPSVVPRESRAGHVSAMAIHRLRIQRTLMNQPQPCRAGKDAICPDRKTYRLECQNHAEPRLVNFYDPEEFQGNVFRWSKPVSMVRLEVPVDDYEVTIETSGLRGADCNFQFQLIWNEHVIPPQQIQVNQGQIRFAVRRSLFVSDREQRLTIACKALDAEKGRRQLGMPVTYIQLTSRILPAGVSDESTVAPVGNSRARIPRKKWRLGHIKNLFRKRIPEPCLPIWQIEMPNVPALQADGSDNRSLTARQCDTVVVSSVEINSRHGTGLLIQYLFGDFSDVATVVSQRCYYGERVRSAAHYELPGGELTRHEIYQQVLQWFAAAPPRRAYVVPFFESDMIVAIALKDLFNTQICLHVMDDNCLYSDEIPAATTEEVIRKSDLSFAISPEMRSEYQHRFGMKMWVLPPIVPHQLIAGAHESDAELEWPHGDSQPMKFQWMRRLKDRLIRQFRPHASQRSRGILIGNVWDRSWLDLLRETIRDSGLEIDWFCNNPEAVWLKESISDLDRDGIHLHDALWGKALVEELKRRPFAIMPSGRLESRDVRESIARLSLPSRIPFVVSTSNTPIMVLGSQESSAARFINRFQLGAVVDYDAAAFREAAQALLDTDVQRAIRSRARKLAATFSNQDLDSWLWASLEKSIPHDDRFEKVFAPQTGEFAFFIDPESPSCINWDKRPVWQMLRRLQLQGINPDMIIDVGASNGVWSWTAAKVFPEARYVLVDPLFSRYDPDHRQHHLDGLKHHELIEAAISNRSGKTEMMISDDLYGSSLIDVRQSLRGPATAEVQVMTLDELARQRRWSGSTLMKVDVQFAEHLVIEGGLEFIRQHVDAMILELTIQPEHPHAKTYREMLELMDELGYQLLDEMEGWRNPVDGRLEQKDAVFVRAEKSILARAA